MVKELQDKLDKFVRTFVEETFSLLSRATYAELMGDPAPVNLSIAPSAAFTVQPKQRRRKQKPKPPVKKATKKGMRGKR
jgi:prophage tail gpP-like protein